MHQMTRNFHVLASTQLIIEDLGNDHLLNRTESVENNVLHIPNKIGLRKFWGWRERLLGLLLVVIGIEWVGVRGDQKEICNNKNVGKI